MKIVIISQNWKSHSDGNFVMKTHKSSWSTPCALGRSGIFSSKKEGDGATPIGRFNVREAFYRADRIKRPQTQIPLYPIKPNDGWCDDPLDRNYNRKIKIPYPNSHELLMRGDHLYDLIVVLDYNISCRKRFAGSAVFFHLAHADYSPTEGCVAVSKHAMLRFLKEATPQTDFIIKR